MNETTIHLNELIIGDKVNMILALKKLKESTDGTLTCVLADKTGTVDASIICDCDYNQLKTQVNGAVKVTAIVKPGPNRSVMLGIKAICPADKSEYKGSDLFDGLSDEKIQEYIDLIHSLVRYIKKPGYRKLVEAALSDEILTKLSQMPATTGYYGRYKGGALAGAACIAEMVKQAGCTYVTHYNGLHAGNIDWSLALTSSLLCTYGVLSYITPEPPFVKTSVGIERGYISVLQSQIEKCIWTNKIDIPDEDVAKLLNTLGCTVSLRTSVRATSKEGILLRHTLAQYAELDMLDYGIAEQASCEEADANGYFYDQKLKRYIAQ